MFCDPLDIPDEVVSALEDGRLVIFAGAGVSMGAPANLPGFRELTEYVAKNTTHAVRKPYDDFLGDLTGEGVEVHKLSHERIAQSKAHNDLHTQLLRLFRHEGRVRVVTTNFDPHFSGAAAALKWQVPVYRAPALPLGRDFEGIVHLHGALTDTPRRLVLTDADLGQAYLTDGWASTFLRSLFAEFTVLFVGYQHDDPPMRYLARGLVGRRGHLRYVLTSDTDTRKWTSMGIVPIQFSLRPKPDDYGALGQGIARWVDIVHLQPLEVEDRLRTILTGPETEPSRSDTDFLRRCLLQEDTAQLFVRHADGLRWLEWLHVQGLVGKYLGVDFLGPEGKDAREKSARRAERLLAGWLGEQLVRVAHARALWLVQDAGGALGGVAAAAIAHRLTNDSKVDLGTELSATWIILLCQSPGPPRRGEMLGRLLAKLAGQKRWPMALRVFGHVCRPRGLLEESFMLRENPGPPEAGMRLKMAAGSIYLAQVWEHHFRPALPELADELLRLLEEALRETQRDQVALGQANERHSRELHIRSYIRLGPPYAAESDLAFVITWFCEVAEFLARSSGRLPPAQLGRWITGGDPVLHRVGLHVLKESVDLAPSAKWHLVVRHKLLFPLVLGARHEVYALLKAVYPLLSEAEREELWRAVEAGPAPGWEDRAEDQSRRAAYRQSQIDQIVWFLHDAFADDAHAKAAFARLMQRSPEYAKAKHENIDVDFWMGGVRDGARSPKPAEELLATEPQQQLDYLLKYKTTNFLEDTREGLVGQVSAASRQQPAWGIQLMRALAASGEWRSDLWIGMFWQLPFTALAVADQRWLLTGVGGPLSATPDGLNAVTYFLFRSGGLFGKDVKMDETVMAELVAASVGLWAKARAAEPTGMEAKLATTDWLQLAINRPAGRIVEFWFAYAEQMRKRSEPPAIGWPQELAAAFDQIATAQTEADWEGLAVVGHVLAFVRSVAPQWTKERIYPLFDFAAQGDKAWPLWRAFVSYGRFNRDLLLELPGYFVPAAAHFAKAEKEVPANFLTAVGIIVYSGLWEAQQSGWLRDVLTPFDVKQRATFAREMGRFLHDVPAKEMNEFWTRWMREYWRERLNGRPFALTAEENGAMVSWAWRLPPEIFAEGAEFLRQGPQPELSDWMPMEMIFQSKLPEQQPAALLDLWTWILGALATGYYTDQDDYLKLLALLPPRAGLLPRWDAVCQALTRHGAACAADLREAGRKHFSQ